MADLERAFDFAMEFEGGGVTHTVPGDPGGTTKWGISQRANPDLDIASLTREGAIEVYRERYWDPMRLDEVRSQMVAEELFEFGINAGPTRAVRAAQAAFNDVQTAIGQSHDRPDNPRITRLDEDGRVGLNTLRALNQMGRLEALAWDGRFNLRQLDYYRNLDPALVRRFLRGWSLRVVR